MNERAYLRFLLEQKNPNVTMILDALGSAIKPKPKSVLTREQLLIMKAQAGIRAGGGLFESNASYLNALLGSRS